MDYITINSIKVPIEGEKNVLSLIRKAGIDIPTFCYHSELSIYGACRMCVVEDDRGKIFAACSETPRAGMVIYTNTKKVQQYRKLIIELLLSSHCRDRLCRMWTMCSCLPDRSNLDPYKCNRYLGCDRRSVHPCGGTDRTGSSRGSWRQLRYTKGRELFRQVGISPSYHGL